MISSVLRNIVVAIVLCNFQYLVAASAENATGPIEFVWPVQRAWYPEYQTTGPCGTNATAGTRTQFPLGIYNLILYHHVRQNIF